MNPKYLFVNKMASRFGTSTVAPIRYRNSLPPAIEPDLFQPTDISGLQLWLEANDPTTVLTNAFGTVEQWINKGEMGGAFDLSGSVDVQCGVNTVNGLDVVKFAPNAYMTGTFTMDFHDRTLFVVNRRSGDISGGFLSWLTSETSNGMESGVIQSGGDYTYILSRHPGFAPEVGFTTTIDTNRFAELATFQNSSTDLSGNYAGLNTTSQTLVVSALAAYNQNAFVYALGNYGNGVPLPNDYDLCEMILYDSVLTQFQREEVELYLMGKWKIADPPAPAFAPIAEYDFNNYSEFDSTLADTLAGDPASINEPFGNTFDTTDVSNNYLTIGAPNNFPSQTGGILLPSLAGIQAVEVWVRYEEWAGYSQYVLDGRNGLTGGFWITSGDAIGSGWDAGTFYNNTIDTPIDATAGTPIVANEIAGAGWRQLWFVPPAPFTDDLALFMRFTGEQGMPVDIAYIAVYDTVPTEADVIAEFNAKCGRYGLSPV